MTTLVKLNKSLSDKFRIRIHRPDGKVLSPLRLQNLDEDELLEMLEKWNQEKNPPKNTKVFRGHVPSSEDAVLCIASLKKQYEDIIEARPEHEEAPKKDEPLDETSVMPNLDYMEEVAMMTVLAGQYYMRNPPWIMLMGSAGSKKSKTSDSFRDSRLVHWGGRATDQSWLPAKTKSDDEDPHSVFRESNNKCLVYTELAALLAGGDENVIKKMGLLTQAYGEKSMPVDSPTGLIEVPCYFSCLWSITSKNYRRNAGLFSQVGQRFLICQVPRTLNDYPEEEIGTFLDDRRKQWVNHVLVTKKRYPVPSLDDMKTMTPEMRKEAHDFVERATILRDALNESRVEDCESVPRLFNQLINMAKLRAMLYHREPTVEDVKFVKPLVIPTIPYVSTLQKIVRGELVKVTKDFKNPINRMLVNLDKLGVINIRDGECNPSDAWYNWLRAEILPVQIDHDIEGEE